MYCDRKASQQQKYWYNNEKHDCTERRLSKSSFEGEIDSAKVWKSTQITSFLRPRTIKPLKIRHKKLGKLNKGNLIDIPNPRILGRF